MKEVVIKISDAMYKYITMEHTICIKEVGEYLFGLVRCTGTLLPKGHGDLIDRSKVIKSLFDYHNGKKTIGQCIDDVEAIIEADKAEGEE